MGFFSLPFWYQAVTLLVLLGVIWFALQVALKPQKGKGQNGQKKAPKQQQQQQQKKEKKPQQKKDKGANKAAAAVAKAAEESEEAQESAPELEAVQSAPENEEPSPVKAVTPAAKAPKAAKDTPKKGGKDSKKAAKKAEAEKPAKEDDEDDEEEAQASSKKKKEKKEKKVEEVVIDDGIDHGDSAAADDWEIQGAVPKKQQRRQARIEAEKEAEKAAVKASGSGIKVAQMQQQIPGSKPAPVEEKKQPGGVKAAPVVELTAEQEKKANEEGNLKASTVTVPEKKIGIVIGPKGATIKLVQEKCGLTKVDTVGCEFTLLGNPKAVALAENAIEELITKGYTSLAYDNFAQAFVMVPPHMMAEIIGKEGCVIRKIKEVLGATIDIPKTAAPAGGPMDRGAATVKSTAKQKVLIAGNTEAVEKTQEVLESIVKFYHHEITHPGYIHDEIEVEPWQLSFIIGKKGSEMKHIQNNFKVKVNIPGEGSDNKNTLIVGEAYNVERAKKYIENLLWNSYSQRSGGRGSDGPADDGWGDEEEEEGWMQAYLYKRK